MGCLHGVQDDGSSTAQKLLHAASIGKPVQSSPGMRKGTEKLPCRLLQPYEDDAVQSGTRPPPGRELATLVEALGFCGQVPPNDVGLQKGRVR